MSYYPGSAEALTLLEAAERIAYCYYCDCGHKERVRLALTVGPAVATGT